MYNILDTEGYRKQIYTPPNFYARTTLIYLFALLFGHRQVFLFIQSPAWRFHPCEEHCKDLAIVELCVADGTALFIRIPMELLLSSSNSSLYKIEQLAR